MIVKRSSKLYENVVSVTELYLGPAADRFISRQIRNHLRIEPDKLTEKDLLDLIDWIRVAMGFITEDRDLIDEYVHSLKALAKDERRA